MSICANSQVQTIVFTISILVNIKVAPNVGQMAISIFIIQLGTH